MLSSAGEDLAHYTVKLILPNSYMLEKIIITDSLLSRVLKIEDSKPHRCIASVLYL